MVDEVMVEAEDDESHIQRFSDCANHKEAGSENADHFGRKARIDQYLPMQLHDVTHFEVRQQFISFPMIHRIPACPNE